MRDLIASRVPIEGEAGVGYALRQGFDLPPLMFDEHEIEALVLGARIIEFWTDAKLAEAAGNVIAKVEAVIPERLRQHMADTALLAPAASFRRADRGRCERAAPRAAPPVQGAFLLSRRRGPPERAHCAAARAVLLWPVWLLAAWCERRQDFRSFRLDRISELDVLNEPFPSECGKTLQDYLKRNDH